MRVFGILVAGVGLVAGGLGGIVAAHIDTINDTSSSILKAGIGALLLAILGAGCLAGGLACAGAAGGARQSSYPRAGAPSFPDAQSYPTGQPASGYSAPGQQQPPPTYGQNR